MKGRSPLDQRVLPMTGDRGDILCSEPSVIGPNGGVDVLEGRGFILLVIDPPELHLSNQKTERLNTPLSWKGWRMILKRLSANFLSVMFQGTV